MSSWKVLLALASASTLAGIVSADDQAPGPRTSKCAPVEVRAVHGGDVLPNARLQRIENGAVPCLHVEEVTVATCLFSTASHAASGKWLESPEGDFALIGQALTLDGQPGGEWIVAARVGGADLVACVEPSGGDTAGRVAEGTELASTCVVETVLSPFNTLSANGFSPIWNFATLEVCASNGPGVNPHPDYADLVRSYASPGSEVDDVFCYTGWAAALNDTNGAERDWLGQYRVGEASCHYLSVSGLEVPAAKRPATRSLPAPGRVVDTTPIVWRPVNPNIPIAN